MARSPQEAADPSKIRDVNFSWRSKEHAVSALPSLLLFVVHSVIAALEAGRAEVSIVCKWAAIMPPAGIN
jgi:hypothetical protein